jgi:prevent-host-death family protein
MIIIPITEAKARLAELVAKSDGEDVVLTRHGKPAAVVLSATRHEALIERLEDLEDSLEIARAKTAGEPTVPWEEAIRRLDETPTRAAG